MAERLTPQNATALVAGADLVVDAADSFAVTYVLSDACLAAVKPLVSASVIGLTGYAGAFCGGGPSYRAVFPDVSVEGGTCATRRACSARPSPCWAACRPISPCIFCLGWSPACWAA